jgi:hypothetical protein
MSCPFSSIRSKAHVKTFASVSQPTDQLEAGNPVITAGNSLAIDNAGTHTQLGCSVDDHPRKSASP